MKWLNLLTNYYCFLQFACDVKAEIIGKPAATFFLAALEGIDVSPEDVSGN